MGKNQRGAELNDMINPDTLCTGESLKPGQGLTSKNGLFNLNYQEDGNLVLYRAKDDKPLWASNTANKSAWRCYMQEDGNLVVYASEGKPVWSSQTYGLQYIGCKLTLSDSGQLVIYDQNNSPMWAAMLNLDLPSEQMLSIVQNGFEKAKSSKNIIVIGAGMSGLVAASLLKQAGHSVTILEANSGVGGRVKTIREPFSEGLYAEAGAMRIPGEHQLVQEYIKKFNLKTNKFIDATDDDYILVNGIKIRNREYKANPDILKYPVSENERGKTADQLFNLAVHPIIDFIQHNPERGWPLLLAKYDQCSVLEYLKENPYHGLSDGAIEMIGVLLDEEEIMMTSFIESIRDQTDINPSNEYWEIIGGNDLLPKAFLSELEANIIYHARVYKIEQNDNQVNISYYQYEGSDNNLRKEEKSITGDIAIVTIPFSALRFVELKPLESFSHQKLKAIRELHYDTSTKILLEFKSRFWEKDNLRGGNTATDLPIRFTYYPSHGIGEPGPAVVLASYTWGDDALRWDALTEENCIYYALKNLEAIHGEQVHQEFVRGVCHSWLKNEYSLGAFALFEPQQQTLLYPFIAQPEGRVHFAGEHTTLKHAWIEGAIQSGIRSAYEVNSYLNRSTSKH
ncbi:MAG TPA: FAD-dependent oxidoreductase [Candidatus Obscuribacterales bacterium]